jgi:hypothetical protein
MRVSHVPEGIFKRILENRRKFPALYKGEAKDVADNLGTSKPEIIDLRKEPKFSELCEFVDKLCQFLEIPPVNVYWIPNYKFPKGFLTSDSGSIVLAGPINTLQQIVIEALATHEWGHGIQGDLERLSQRGGELATHYQHRREFESDAASAVLASWWGTHEMLKLFQAIKTGKFGDNSSTEDNLIECPLVNHTSSHPCLLDRRISSLQIILSRAHREFVERGLTEGIHAPDFCQRGVDFYTSRINRERVLKLIAQAPFREETDQRYRYNGWQFSQTKKYGIPPPEFALR